MNTGLAQAGHLLAAKKLKGVIIMKKEDQGFISISSSVADSKTFFVENELPQEGDVLELVVVKNDVVGDSCTLKFKLRSVKK